MVSLTKRFEFEASHYLTGMHEGHVCATTHSHTYTLELTLTPIGELNNGLVIDTGRLKTDVMPVIRRLQGKCLNNLTDPAPWSQQLAAQPTVEHLAMYFWNALEFLSKGKNFRLIRVCVYESPMISAAYYD